MDYSKAYAKLKADHPEVYTALAILPVTGQVAAIADYAEAMQAGDSGAAALAAASIIPGIKLAKMGSKLAPASLRLKSQMNPVERAIAPIVKHAPAIGKAMAAEQVGEYVASKKPVNQHALDQAEYEAAWADANPAWNP